MFLRLLLLFTIVPLVELWLLLRISEFTSPLFTVALVLLTGFVGAALARRQGWQTWRRIQQQLAQGQPPTESLLDGMMILLAGAVLITPGVLTDLLGFSLLVPAFRKLVRHRAAAWLKTRAMVQFHANDAAGSTRSNSAQDDSIIDAEFTRHPTDGD